MVVSSMPKLHPCKLGNQNSYLISKKPWPASSWPTPHHTMFNAPNQTPVFKGNLPPPSLFPNKKHLLLFAPPDSSSLSPPVKGKSLDSPEKENVNKSPKNVEKMPEKCPKIVRRHCKQYFQSFFAYFLPIWSVLLFGDLSNARPLQK